MTTEAEDRLEAVGAVLARLAALDLPPEAQRLVAEARTLCQPMAVGPDQGAEIDPAVLDRVLTLVDPSDGRVLMERLQLDLIQCRDALTEGVAEWDWPRLRLGAHNLVSLAGTAGAEPLRRDALALVAWCDNRDRAAIEAGLTHILPPLGHLLEHLKEKAAAMPGEAS
jgi:hypothetical protein